MIDTKAANIFLELQQRGEIPSALKDPKELDREQMKVYRTAVDDYTAFKYVTMDDIKTVIIREMRFRQPNFINVELISNLEDAIRQDPIERQMNQVYVFPAFIKPGRQIYAVAYPDERRNPSFFVHKLIVKPREELVPHFVKETKISKVGRQFDKNKTIFREWRVDT